MRNLPFLILFSLIITVHTYTSDASEQVNISDLALEQYWALSGIKNLQPSGLSVCGSELVMVSDRHNLTVFSIPHSNTVSTQVKIFKSITPFSALPDHTRWQEHLVDWGLSWTNKRFDWEGIHCNVDGSLYLASESLSAVANIKHNGSASWVTPSFFTELKDQGFVAKLNTGFEGITAHSGSLLIALEREPRGLIKTNQHATPPTIGKISKINNEGVVTPLTADFTGLWLEHNAKQQPKIYTLERNYFRVCRRTYESWTIEACWSYRLTEKAPQFRFENDRYGLAEGIARSGEYIYIVLDNNGEARQQSGDIRPLLFKFKRPNNW